MDDGTGFGRNSGKEEQGFCRQVLSHDGKAVLQYSRPGRVTVEDDDRRL